MRLTNRSYLPYYLLRYSLLFHSGCDETLSFRLDTDYNVILPMATFALRRIRIRFRISAGSNIGLGYQPSEIRHLCWARFICRYFFLFGPDNGLRCLSRHDYRSGLSMWYFLSSFKLRPWAIAWGAILYEFSGALAAMIAAGHVKVCRICDRTGRFSLFFP